MKRLFLFVAIAGLAIALSATTPAKAGDGYGWGGGWNYGLYYNAVVPESIPYFAQFPPVYYSQPVPRPYGWSPYAYPPGVFTPEPEPVPQMTVNPFTPPIDKEKLESKKEDNLASAPLRLANPYFEASDPASPTSIAQVEP